MRASLAVIFVWAVSFLAGCPPPVSETPAPPPPIETTPAPTPTPAPDPPPPSEPPAPEPQPTGSAEDGAACDAPGDCKSGICEGEGCASGQGRCASQQRMCTRDLVAYCGCDNTTFRNSGSCPGKRYQKKGPCPGDSPFGP